MAVVPLFISQTLLLTGQCSDSVRASSWAYIISFANRGQSIGLPAQICIDIVSSNIQVSAALEPTLNLQCKTILKHFVSLPALPLIQHFPTRFLISFTFQLIKELELSLHHLVAIRNKSSADCLRSDITTCFILLITLMWLTARAAAVRSGRGTFTHLNTQSWWGEGWLRDVTASSSRSGWASGCHVCCNRTGTSLLFCVGTGGYSRLIIIQYVLGNQALY